MAPHVVKLREEIILLKFVTIMLMKAFIFDPLWANLVTIEQGDALVKAGIDYKVVSELAPLIECSELFEGDEERVLCLNPDYVGWKLSGDGYKDIPNLKAIHIASTDFSWIDVQIATERNVPVCNY